MPLGRSRGLRAPKKETRHEMLSRRLREQRERAKAKKFRAALAKIKADKALVREFAIREERDATARGDRMRKRKDKECNKA